MGMTTANFKDFGVQRSNLSLHMQLFNTRRFLVYYAVGKMIIIIYEDGSQKIIVLSFV